MSARAAPWLAWSLATLSVVLLVGGIALAQMTLSTVAERPYYGSVTLSVLALAFSVVGAIIASRQPRNAIGWIFCSIGLVVSLSSLTGDYAEYWLARGSAPGTSPRRRPGSPRGRGLSWYTSQLASCCCCSPTAGYLRPAGGPWPGALRSGSSASSRATC
jgi:hypothetical protein